MTWSRIDRRTIDLDAAHWVAFPEKGRQAGEGGDCYEVAFFDDGVAALLYANERSGFRALPIRSGQTINEALKAHLRD